MIVSFGRHFPAGSTVDPDRFRNACLAEGVKSGIARGETGLFLGFQTSVGHPSNALRRLYNVTSAAGLNTQITYPNGGTTRLWQMTLTHG